VWYPADDDDDDDDVCGIIYCSGLGYIIGTQVAGAFGQWQWGLRVRDYNNYICVVSQMKVEIIIVECITVPSKMFLKEVPSLSCLQQGWPSGESCPPPMWPWFDFSTRFHMWIEFVGSLLCHERFFPRYSSFPLSSKTNKSFDLI